MVKKITFLICILLCCVQLAFCRNTFFWNAVEKGYPTWANRRYELSLWIELPALTACYFKGPGMSEYEPAEWLVLERRWNWRSEDLTLSQLQTMALGVWNIRLIHDNAEESFYSCEISGSLQENSFLPIPEILEPAQDACNVHAQHYVIRWDPHDAQVTAHDLWVEIGGPGFLYKVSDIGLTETFWHPGWLQAGKAYCKVGYVLYRPDMISNLSHISGPLINWDIGMAFLVSGDWHEFYVKNSMDFNKDNVINLADLATVYSHWLVMVNQNNTAPFYHPQVNQFVNLDEEYIFIKNTECENSWAGGDNEAVETAGINDNKDSVCLGVPEYGFRGNQGLALAMNTTNDADYGSACVLTSAFAGAKGGPGGSGLTPDLSDVTLYVDIAFDVPEVDGIDSIDNALGIWLLEEDGDVFDQIGTYFTLTRNWNRYEIDLDELSFACVDPSGGGVLGDSPIALVGLELNSSDTLGFPKIIYYVDDFLIEYDGGIFYEDFEGYCTTQIGGDINEDCRVDLLDFAILAAHWLETDRSETLSQHVHEISIIEGIDYGHPDVPGDKENEFILEISTDETVASVDLLLPDETPYSIPDIPENCVGPVCTEHYMENGLHIWRYAEASSGPIQNYDGLFTIIVQYENGQQETTSAWFGIPNSCSPIPKVTQIPVITYPANGSTVSSPVTIQWGACHDPAATNINILLQNEGTGEDIEQSFPTDATSWQSLNLTDNSYEIELDFRHFYSITDNGDGIRVEVGKYTQSDYEFVVE